ncbi:hypothetical protein LJ753_06640 [Arthrobacter sp. zg-Y20]|nr:MULTISPECIES: hypothetical protein [unclassified Arthrobacter]MCC3275548.1 hypothetical protein [Arthrobacter sp. zg-Y20]MDK1315705.1 hypothetical protein [Arthrobacter sp. zg.Y20]WIB06114.1 hypothetical protein QNO06_16615 [Arthrobacter sp. zg-Y20]
MPAHREWFTVPPVFFSVFLDTALNDDGAARTVEAVRRGAVGDVAGVAS